MTVVVDRVVGRWVFAGSLAEELERDRVTRPDLGLEVVLCVADIGLKKPGTCRMQ